MLVHPRPLRRRTALIAAGATALALLLVAWGPATARAATSAAPAPTGVLVTAPVTPFDTNLRAAFRGCLDASVDFDPGYQRLDLADVFRCLGNRGYTALAFAPAGSTNLTSRTPAPSHFEWDLFNTFTNCLSEAAGGDSMYPGINPREVNMCLERYDFY